MSDPDSRTELMKLSELLASVASLLATQSENSGRETAEIKQVRKNIAGYAAAMGRGSVDPVTSSRSGQAEVRVELRFRLPDPDSPPTELDVEVYVGSQEVSTQLGLD